MPWFSPSSVAAPSYPPAQRSAAHTRSRRRAVATTMTAAAPIGASRARCARSGATSLRTLLVARHRTMISARALEHSWVRAPSQSSDLTSDRDRLGARRSPHRKPKICSPKPKTNWQRGGLWPLFGEPQPGPPPTHMVVGTGTGGLERHEGMGAWGESEPWSER